MKNNLVMAPMTRCMSQDNGLPTDKLTDNYILQAKNGFNLIIIESSAVNDSESLGYKNGSKFFNKEHSDYWRQIINELHRLGSEVYIQLYHAGRLTVKEIIKNRTLAPSAIDLSSGSSFWRPKINDQIVHFQTGTRFETPKAMTLDEIEKTISDFENSCKLAVEAGFDGVELHGAHGYLLHTFCSAITNKRKDIYGYDENFYFVDTLVKRCKEALGKKNLCYRLSLHMIDNTYIKYNKTVMNYELLVKVLDAAGVDIFHSSEIKAGQNLIGHNKSLMSVIKENTSKKIIVCGGIRNKRHIDSLISKGADMIAFGRPILSNFDLIKKIENNENLSDFDYLKHFYI